MAEVLAECDELLEEREKSARRFRTLVAAAKKEEAEAEAEINALLENGDDPDALEELTAKASAAKLRAEIAKKQLDALESKPLLDASDYERMKTAIFDAVEIEKQAFVEMLAAHAGTLAAESKALAEYTERANGALKRLQFDVYGDHNRTEERNGRKYAYIARPERVDTSGLIQAGRQLALLPLLSGRVCFRDHTDLATAGFGESVK